jgi:hypothetical protein
MAVPGPSTGATRTSALTVASRSAAFEEALGYVDEGFKAWLNLHRMAALSVLGFLFEANATDTEILSQARGILCALRAADPEDQWAGLLLFLCKVARGEAVGAAQRAGSVSQLQVSFDREASSHEAAARHREVELHRTGLDHLARLPTEWRGKRYRRRERTANDHERAEAYRKERDREGQQVMALLLEANLPFAKTLERVGPDDAAAQRCCLGMQPKSLRQRLACWRPVREFLLQAHRGRVSALCGRVP